MLRSYRFVSKMLVVSAYAVFRDAHGIKVASSCNFNILVQVSDIAYFKYASWPRYLSFSASNGIRWVMISIIAAFVR